MVTKETCMQILKPSRKVKHGVDWDMIRVWFDLLRQLRSCLSQPICLIRAFVKFEPRVVWMRRLFFRLLQWRNARNKKVWWKFQLFWVTPNRFLKCTFTSPKYLVIWKGILKTGRKLPQKGVMTQEPSRNGGNYWPVFKMTFRTYLFFASLWLILHSTKRAF